MVDVTLVSPWTEPVAVNPSYQLIREEIDRCMGELIPRRIGAFLEAHPANAADYTKVVRYRTRVPFSPGLLSIAAYLEEAGYTVRLVCLDVHREMSADGPGWLKTCVDAFCKTTRIAVGVTSVTPEICRALQVLEEVKSSAPWLRTMIGGTHVTYEDVDAALHPAVDAVVRGEGEATALELVSRWASGRPIADIDGITLESEGTVVRNRDRKLLDLSALPMPAYHLLDRETADRIHLVTMYTRGCPYKCSYCVESSFWHRLLRHKTPEKFVDEIEYVADRFDWRLIHIADSTFGLNRDATVRLCEELERRRPEVLFSINVRPDVFRYMGQDLVERLIENSFVEWCMGFESASDELIASLERRQTYDATVDALTRLKNLGAPFVALYTFVGAPGETHESVQRTINAVRLLLQQELISYATTKTYIPTPGTDPFSAAEQQGIRSLSRDFRLYERYGFPPPYLHSNLSAFEIEHYIALMQAVQLKVLRDRLGGEEEMQDRIREWANRTYLRRIYL